MNEESYEESEIYFQKIGGKKKKNKKMLSSFSFVCTYIERFSSLDSFLFLVNLPVESLGKSILIFI